MPDAAARTAFWYHAVVEPVRCAGCQALQRRLHDRQPEQRDRTPSPRDSRGEPASFAKQRAKNTLVSIAAAECRSRSLRLHSDRKTDMTTLTFTDDERTLLIEIL